MKNFLLLFIPLLIHFNSATAQLKEFKKLDEQFALAQYQKCIENALKYNKNEPQELNPVIYLSKSYYELFKTEVGKEKQNHLKNSLKFANRITAIDKNGNYLDKYSKFMEDLHNSSLEFGNEVYLSSEKEKSKHLFDYLVKIYSDTTAQYLYFHPEEVKKTNANPGVNTMNEKINQTDKNGLKQGYWKKVYPNKVLAYEVRFKDDKPVGEMKRYHENGKLMALLKYDDNGEWASAKHYNEKAELIAEGKYHGKLKSGLWLFYMDGIKRMEETYDEGLKTGVSKSHFKNGKPAEEKHWEKDVENGVWRQFYLSGNVKLETRIDNGIRNSVFYCYYENGKFETKGHYKNDKMEGDWIYFDKDGKELERINYVNGKTSRQKELDEKENEVFKKLEQNKGRLIDPADFINNPNEYLQKNGLK